MSDKIFNYVAHLFLGIFHPLFLLTIGSFTIFKYLPGSESYSLKLQYTLLGIIFVSTCLLPFIFTQTLTLSGRLGMKSTRQNEILLPYVFSALCIFLGAQLVGKLPLPSVFRIYMLGYCLILIVLFIINTKWRISNHAAGIGGIIGVFLGLTFKYGLDLKWMIIASIIISGIIGTSLIYLKKNTPIQVYAGVFLSVLSMYLIIYFF